MLGLVGITDVLLLIALGVGYLVLYFAKREEKGLQFAGYIIGGVIIVLAIVYLLGNIWLQSGFCGIKKRYYKGIMQPRSMHPPMPKLPAQKP